MKTCEGDVSGEFDLRFDVAPPPPVIALLRKRNVITVLHIGVEAARVRHADSLICSLPEVQAASNLVADRIAGARPDVITRVGWTRMPDAKQEIAADLLRSPSMVTRADGGGSTARRGRVWMLTAGIPIFIKRLNKMLAKAKQKPMSEKSARLLIAGKEYTVMKANQCCCAACRNFGFHVYVRWRDTIRSVLPASPKLTAILAAITEEERYRSSEVLTHLQDEDAVAEHCRCLALSSFNDVRFRADCLHPRSDGTYVAPPLTMAQRLGRAPRSSDWHSTCDVCAAGSDLKSSRLLVCQCCPRACHQKCIEAIHADLPSTDSAYWTCWDCVRLVDATAHNERSLRCETHKYLIGDSKRIAELAKFDAIAASGSTEVSMFALAAIDNFDADLTIFHAHKIQTSAQELFQPWAILNLTPRTWTTLQDYWAKQAAKLHMTATCEGMANIGVSVHGVMRTFRNPKTAIREKWPEIDWDAFPNAQDAPVAPGPANARVFYRYWSDSSKQDAFDTSATVLEGDAEFLRQHPWLDPAGDFGTQSDGAPNYICSSTLIYAWLNPNQQFQFFSIAGEGKDQVDRDNGSEQRKIKLAVDGG